MKHHFQDRNSELGKVDIAVSIGLFIASAILLFFGSQALSRTITEPKISLPIQLGGSYLSLEDTAGNMIGRVTVKTHQAQQIEMHGYGELALNDEDIKIEFSSKLNLLNQLQHASINFSDEKDNLSYELNGIYPLHSSTVLEKDGQAHTASSTHTDLLECSIQQTGDPTFSCNYHPVLIRLSALSSELDINIVPTDRFVAVPLYPSSVTFKELQRALLSTHLPLEEYDPVR